MRYKSMGRTAAALAVGLSVLLTGCSAQAAPEEAAEAASASPEPSPSETGPAGPSLPGGEIVQSAKGEYLQSTIAADDPILKYDPSKNIGNPEEFFTVEQLDAAYEFALTFIAEEVIDSPLNNNPDGDIDAWWEEHKKFFDPVWRASIRKQLEEEEGPVMRSPWQEQVTSFPYNYVYSPIETRFSERNLRVNEFYHSDKGVLVLKTDWDVTAKVRLPDGLGTGTETTRGYTSLGLIPSELNDSGWIITYYDWKPTEREVSEPLRKLLDAEFETGEEDPSADG